MSDIKLNTAAGGSITLRPENTASDVVFTMNANGFASAANVSFAPTGNIAATNVQNAIAEVVTDLAASSGAASVGYLPAGTGAVATTVQAKLRETVSVTDFYANGVSGAKVDPTGVIDSTVGIQAALDSGAKLITAPAGSVFKTSNTLFVTTSDTIVDFNGAKIVNSSNSRYAICLVTPNIGAKTEANLAVVQTTLNYGSEIFNSHIRNVVVEMSATTSGGSNLGVGIVYGKNCSISNVVVTQSNGNGIEVRNSTNCLVENVNLTVRSYGAFFFMTKDCSIVDSYITGCVRGIVTKMSQSGASVNFRAARCVVENLSSGFYYTVGGEWKERVLTDPIYQSGHENVADVTYEDCTFRSATDQAKVTLGYWASRFTYKGCVFQSSSYSAGAGIGADGNQVGGDVQGKSHKFIGCTFVNGSTLGNAAITATADTLISGCVFTGSYQRLLIADQTYTPIVTFSNNLVQGTLLTLSDSANCLLTKQANAILLATGNTITMTVGFSGNAPDTISGVAKAPTAFSGNTVRIAGSGTYAHTSVYLETGICHGNSLYYSDFTGTVYSILVSDAGNVQNNVVGNNGVVGGSSRALYMSSSSIEVVKNEGNQFSGTWSATQFANLAQNYQYFGRVKSLSAVPTAGTWAVGDRVFNSVPVVGQPKSWVCTVAGTPGTWVSEGNL